MHPPSASRSTSPPQPFDLFSNGGQPGMQSASRGSPSTMQPLHTEPRADAAARTGARGGPFAAAADAANLPSPAVLSAPNVTLRKQQGAQRQGFVLEPDGILVSARPRPSPVTEQQPRMPNGKRSALDALASSPDGGAGGSRGDVQVDGLGPARRQQRRAAAAVDDAGPQRGVASVPASVRDAGSSGSGSTQLLHDLDDLASMEDARRLRGGGHTTLGTADGAASDDEQVTFEAAMEEEAAEEEAAEEEAAEEEAAMETQPAEGAAVEMDDERASVAAEDEASETDDMEELVEEVQEPPVGARATGAKHAGLELASWDDDDELEPETGHAGNPLPPRSALTTRCRHAALACTAASPPASPCSLVAAGASKSTLSTRACTR